MKVEGHPRRQSGADRYIAKSDVTNALKYINNFITINIVFDGEGVI